MFASDSASMALKEQIIPILLIGLCLALAFLLLHALAARRHRLLSRERGAVSEDTFAGDMERAGFDPVIARSTFRYLQEVQRVRFPVLAQDRLDEDLGLDSADIQESVTDLTASLGRTPTPALRHYPLITVEDLVRGLQAAPPATLAEAA